MASSPQTICITNGMFQENCYIVADMDSHDAVLIDPGEETDLFLRRLTHEELTLRAIWLTHGHLDHVDGVKRVVEKTDAEIYLHPEDRQLYERVGQQGAALGVQSEVTLPPPDHELAHGDVLKVGRYSFDVRHVPGHSKGGVAFVGHGLVFSGDSLFAGSIGRTDLPGGDTKTLLASIKEQLLTLPPETVVYSGHGPQTTIGVEKASNPFLTGTYGLF